MIDSERRARILVVDDEHHLRLVAVRTLEKAGYQVSQAGSCAAARDAIREQRPDLVLLDVVLRDGDGTELCREIKSDPALRSVYVILLSSLRTSSDEQAFGLDAGADGYIARPVPNRELQARVRAMLRLKWAEEESRAEKLRAQKYLDIAPAVFVALDRQGTIALANRRTHVLLGYEEGELLGKDWFDICIPEGQRHEIRQVFARLMAGQVEQVQEYENPVLTKSGDERMVVWNNTLLRDAEDAIVGLLSSGEDVTDQRRAARLMKEYSERLEAMVQERTKELEAAQEKLVRRERLAVLGQLAGGVGHDLRNPLAAINNAVYLLRMLYQQGVSSLDEGGDINEYLDLIGTEVRKAEGIVADLLDLARVRPPSRHLFALEEVMARVQRSCPPPPEVQFEPEIPGDLPQIHVDAQQLERVLINLVTNAYQGMPEGGRLAIGARQRGEAVEVSVADTGQGIAQEDLDRIFEPLFTTRTHGVGLGLAIVKNLVEANGGTIAVESAVGVGTTFTLMLPAAPGA